MVLFTPIYDITERERLNLDVKENIHLSDVEIMVSSAYKTQWNDCMGMRKCMKEEVAQCLRCY